MTITLTSNGYSLSMTKERLGRMEPSDPSLAVDALKEQYRTQGYLWLKGLLRRDDVLNFRRRFFAAFEGTGLLAPGSDPRDGRYAGAGEDREACRSRLAEIARWATYESFCLMPPVVEFYEAFLGGPAFLHKRKIVRFTKPGDPNATGAHYDLIYLRAGTERICTSWIPVGDTPVSMGGVIYLEGSDRWGRQMEAEFSERNASLSPDERVSAYNKNMSEEGWLTKDLGSLADRLDARWLIADYEAGDMTIHSPYMIHASTTNEARDGAMRLSTDIRYQLVRDEIDPRWQESWQPDDGL